MYNLKPVTEKITTSVEGDYFSIEDLSYEETIEKIMTEHSKFLLKCSETTDELFNIRLQYNLTYDGDYGGCDLYFMGYRQERDSEFELRKNQVAERIKMLEKQEYEEYLLLKEKYKDKQ